MTALLTKALGERAAVSTHLSTVISESLVTSTPAACESEQQHDIVVIMVRIKGLSQLDKNENM